MSAFDVPDGPSNLAVTVVVSRRPAPGREAELTEWAHGIIAAAEQFPGHLGGRVFPPSPTDSEDLVIAFSFATAQDLSVWESSPVRQEWLDRAGPLIVGPHRSHAVSGFEGLFAPSVGAAAAPPPRWKTATIIALALYPASLLINWLLAPHLSSLNLFLRVLVTTALLVPFMVWVGVPWLSRWLARWLRR